MTRLVFFLLSYLWMNWLECPLKVKYVFYTDKFYDIDHIVLKGDKCEYYGL